MNTLMNKIRDIKKEPNRTSRNETIQYLKSIISWKGLKED